MFLILAGWVWFKPWCWSIKRMGWLRVCIEAWASTTSEPFPWWPSHSRPTSWWNKPSTWTPAWRSSLQHTSYAAELLSPQGFSTILINQVIGYVGLIKYEIKLCSLDFQLICIIHRHSCSCDAQKIPEKIYNS